MNEHQDVPVDETQGFVDLPTILDLARAHKEEVLDKSFTGRGEDKAQETKIGSMVRAYGRKRF